MKILAFIILILISAFSLKSQNTDLLWAINFTGTGSNQPVRMVTDVSGNIYVLGIFSGTVNQGALSITSSGGNDIFIAKYNKSGQIIWLKQAGGTLVDVPSTICLSNDGNYFYISGATNSNPCNFDATAMATVGGSDLFIAKYAVDGTLQWAHNSGYSASNQFGGNLSVDNSENIILSGMFLTNITFYGGVTSLISPAPAVRQCFISKFDSNGNLIWAKMLVTDNSLTTIRNVSSDATGYYLSGNFVGNFTLDIGNILSLGSSDGFLYKTDFLGTGQWVRKVAGTGSEVFWRHYGDATGFQFITGYYDSPSLTIDSTGVLSSTLTLPNAGSNDILYFCYAPDGTLQFGKSYGSTGDDQGQAISVNADHVIFGGQYTGAISFGSFNLSNSATDAFMVETNKSGTVLSAKRAYGANTDITKTSRISADSTNIFCGDYLSSTLNVEENILTNAAVGVRDMFLVKYGKINISKVITNTNCAAGSTGAIDLTITGNGTTPYTFAWSGPGATTPTEDQTGLITGMYHVTLTDANGATKVDSAFVDVLPAMSAVLDQHSALLICAADANGEATVITTDGVPPFTYTWDDMVAPLATRNDLDTGWHYVTITDVCNVPIEDSIKVNYLPELNISITASTPATCPAGTDGYAHSLATSGVPPYTYAWSNSTSTIHEASDLPTGWQYVTVTDFCISRVDSINVTWNPIVTASTVMNSAVTCTGLNNGSATITASLGKAPYTYLWSNGETNATAILLVENWNYCTVTDACGSTKKDSINMPVLTLLSSSVSLTTQASCPTSTNGAATATVTDGVPPYTYLWTSGELTAAASNLSVGWQYVTITAGCGIKKDSVLVTNMPLMQASLSTTNILLICATDLGSATVQTINGVAPFTYTWDDMVAPSPTRNDLDTGWHYVTVTDVCNMPFTGSIRVNSLPEVSTIIVSSQVASCPTSTNGQATVQASSGVPPYTYLWSSGETTAAATALSTGWQFVTVTDFCKSKKDSVFIGSMPPLTTSITASTSTNCTGAFNGSATVTATNGGAPYTYLWTSGENTATATALGQGWNYVTVSDVCLTSKKDSVNISVQSALVEATTLTSQTNCPASSEGAAAVTVSSGIPPYSYLWSTGAITPSVTNLPVGWVYVTITDGCGPKKDSVQVTNKPLMSVSLSTTNILLICSTDMGSATAITTNGVAPFTYTWDDMVAPSATRNDLDTGWHYVTVTDVCNIPFTGSIRVNSLPEVTSTIVSSQVASCPGGNDGKATVQASSGVPPYTYLWTSGEVTAAATALTTGWQYVTVTDFCKSRLDSVNIGSMPPLTTSITASASTNCTGAFNGSATVTATNGGAPYTYLWTSGEATPTATALGEGWNYVTVSDVCLSTKKDSVNISVLSALVENVSLTAQATCPVNSDGSATVTVTSGVAPFTYLWSTGDVTPVITNLPVGWVFVTVTDGCGPKKDSIEVTNVPLMQVSLSTQNILLTCANDNGTSTVLTQFGVAPYTYTWDDMVAASPTRNDLDTGWHYVTVTDFCNLPYYDSVRVNHLPEVMTEFFSSGLASCAAGGDGSATVVAESGVPPYTYLWTSGETTAAATALLTGWQYVTVSDYCITKVDSIEISSMAPMTIVTTAVNAASCSGSTNGMAYVTAQFGGQPYTYLWSTTEAIDTAYALIPGWNYVTVTDGCGSLVDSVLITITPPLSIAISSPTSTSCAGGNNGSATVNITDGANPFSIVWSTNNLFTDTINQNAFAGNLNNAWNYVQVYDMCDTLIDSVQIGSLPILTASFTFNVPASCPTTADGKASVTASNGATPYTYTWSNSASLGFVATDLLPGWNYVTVTDQCGFVVDSVIITNKPQLSISTSISGLITCQNDSDGTAIVATTDGVTPFTFVWSTTEANDTALALVEGWNYVTVTDVCGTLIDSVNMTVTPVVTATFDKLNEIFCFGDTTARVQVNASNGILPYSYAWGDTTLTTFNRNNLRAGKYYFTVTDACTSTYADSIIVSQPGALSLSMLTTNTSFIGYSDGAIDLIMSGGSQPYSYNWSNSVILEDQTAIPEGVYYITVTDINGCVISDSATIVTDSWHIEIYNAFSPNGDGKNDVWNIKYIEAYPDCDITIFDEWGIKVFESTGYATPWDGTSKKGNKLPAATYYYIIDLKDGSKAFTGSVAILK